MKKLIFLMGILGSQVSLAQIKFEQAVTTNPLVVEVVSSYCSSSICKFFDSSSRVRLMIVADRYSLHNSADQVVNTVLADAEVIKKTGRILMGSSASCPGKIYIDRNSIKIFEVRSSCAVSGIKTVSLESAYEHYYGKNISLRDGTVNTRVTYDYTNKEYTVNFGHTMLNSAVKVAPTEVQKFEYYIKSIRKDCPLTIDYNSETGVITRMKTGCDPLALKDDGIRNG